MIMSIDDAREILRISGTDNDVIIASLLEAIPNYLEVTTGKSWDEEPVNPLAQTTAKFILQLWYNPQGPDTERLKITINSLLFALTAIAREPIE